MPKGLLFWILMLLWLVLGLWGSYTSGWERRWVAGSLLIFILFLVLGWAVFGPPLQ